MLILIESQWNLKTAVPAVMKIFKSDINRITVEFKAAFFMIASVSVSILIESQWNLKGKKLQIDYHKYNHINRITVEFKVNSRHIDNNVCSEY